LTLKGVRKVAYLLPCVWSTGRDGKECGLVTGATLVAPQIKWITETAKALGSALEK
jgi:hypothetical protein